MQRPQPGQRFRPSATDQRQTADAVEWVQRQQTSSVTDPPPIDEQRDVVDVRNDTGTNVDYLGVVGLGNPIIDEATNSEFFKRRVTFEGETPTAAHYGKFAVMLDMSADQAIVHAAISGIVPVQVEIVDICHEFADVQPGSRDRLESVPLGSAQILWRAGGLGLQWCVVRLSNPERQLMRFTLQSGLVPGGNALALRADSLGHCDGDCEFTIWDPIGVSAPSADVGKLGWATWQYDVQRWEAVAIGVDCRDESSSSESSSSDSSSISESISESQSESDACTLCGTLYYDRMSVSGGVFTVQHWRAYVDPGTCCFVEEMLGYDVIDIGEICCQSASSESSSSGCCCPGWDEVTSLNVTISGAISATGTLSVGSAIGEGECGDTFEGTFFPTGCGEFTECTLQFFCLGNRAEDFRLGVIGIGELCDLIPTNADGTYAKPGGGASCIDVEFSFTFGSVDEEDPCPCEGSVTIRIYE